VLYNSSILKKNIHFIRAELEPLKARVEYENTLKEIDEFDVVLLSMGEDGHIASLFPKHEYPEVQNVIVEHNSPKPPKERISMSYKRLNKSQNVFKIVSGRSKQSIVGSLLQGESLPFCMVSGKIEKIFIHCSAISGECKK
jgi:6-phosphogluconolactonase